MVFCVLHLAIVFHGEILILPLRLLNQSNGYHSLYSVGGQAFISLFNGIDNLNDYFAKCNSIDDIIRFAREDIGRLVMFSEDDNVMLRSAGECVKLRLDHSSTTDRCGNNGGCTSRKFWKQRCSEQKWLKASRNCYKNYQKSLGKDEVGSSNLPSSSRTTPEIFG